MKKNNIPRVLASMCRKIIASILIFSAITSYAAQNDTCTVSPKLIHHIGADVRPSYVASSRNATTYSYDDGERPGEMHTALSAHMKWSFSFSDATKLGRMYPEAYQGIGIGYTSFFNSDRIGNPIGLYIFQGAPIVHLSDRLSLNYEWNFGATFGWKKYDPELPHVNLVVGSKVNAYINLGLMLKYRISKRINLTAGIDMSHYSNGNTSWPNPGVNSIGGRVGVVYTLNTVPERRNYAMPDTAACMKPHISYDMVVYGAARKRAVETYETEMVPGHFAVAGINFAPMYNFNRYFRAGLSADIQYDEGSNLSKYWIEGTHDENIKFRRQPFKDCISAGVSIRGELVMPIFSINMGIGRNFIACHENRNFYQILALKVHIMPQAFLHIGYQLNSFKNPNNLMIGFGYRFHDKR
ncbi:MAG TPA: acyloxyacyl hydrolase [Muribaculum sp.]|uniref:Acyloxyacyl hydrolase n=1 Tax=Heminiphilus faecis TaxID=2601703 RepID=A0ABV4CUS4_9BACT|nr:acyloxyacyl hydrolase [Heminiphilus faecis]RLT77668.1 acyloxyacyl hydrolase [bacterium J10(2018)]HRF69012.1 acyloxyacyl hydrolase [Muribaculum sp.]